MSSRRIGACVLLVGVAACAGQTPAPSDTPSTASASTAQGRRPDVLTEEELSDPSVRDTDVLQVIRRLRPAFLSSRGVSSLNNPSAGSVQVSTDGGALTGTDVLAGIRAGDVAEIRYLSPSSAAQRFGTTANAGGVILVKRK